MLHNSNYAFTATFKDQDGNTTSGYTFANAFTTGTASQTGITQCNDTNCVVNDAVADSQQGVQ